MGGTRGKFWDGSQGSKESEGGEKATQYSSELTHYPESTTSTKYSFGSPRKALDMSKYNDLNLWLFDHEKSMKLEEELSATRAGAGLRNMKGLSLERKSGEAMGLLPAVAMKKRK